MLLYVYTHARTNQYIKNDTTVMSDVINNISIQVYLVIYQSCVTTDHCKLEMDYWMLCVSCTTSRYKWFKLLKKLSVIIHYGILKFSACNSSRYPGCRKFLQCYGWKVPKLELQEWLATTLSITYYHEWQV
jgi:hypothetical protein